jgi:hypothetical protein
LVQHVLGPRSTKVYEERSGLLCRL